MPWINSYGCVAANMSNIDQLWNALIEKKSLTSHGYFAQRFPTTRELLGFHLLQAFNESKPVLSGNIGVILASTKGMSNDFIWSEQLVEQDPLTPILQDFLKATKLNVQRSVCVSNACSSTLAALELARRWLKQDIDTIVILAADAVTPFVIKGFQSLNLVTSDCARPFAKDRSGFFLGEASACLIVSNRRQGFSIQAIGLDTEGYAVARPSHSGESLIRAARRLGNYSADLIYAHGTATKINDATEDLAFSVLFKNQTPIITGSKWCVGHTLASSAAIDTILACESIKRGGAAFLATTEQVDPTFKGTYLTANLFQDISRVLISSLGFGGMHAMALVGRG